MPAGRRRRQRQAQQHGHAAAAPPAPPAAAQAPDPAEAAVGGRGGRGGGGGRPGGERKRAQPGSAALEPAADAAPGLLQAGPADANPTATAARPGGCRLLPDHRRGRAEPGIPSAPLARRLRSAATQRASAGVRTTLATATARTAAAATATTAASATTTAAASAADPGRRGAVLERLAPHTGRCMPHQRLREPVAAAAVTASVLVGPAGSRGGQVPRAVEHSRAHATAVVFDVVVVEQVEQTYYEAPAVGLERPACDNVVYCSF